jgi:hypothetical protein
MPERCEPGGEASSQDRKPVSASAVMASSTLSESPVESSTTTSLTGHRPAADRHSNHGFSESAEVLTLYLCQIPREAMKCGNN